MYNKILNESLTVNDNVKRISSDIKKELIMRANSDMIVMSKEFNRILKKGMFTYFPNGLLAVNIIKVKYYIYQYANEKKYYQDYKNRVIELNGACDYENKTITLRMATINGNLSKESFGVIEHEISHFLQNSLGQRKNETLYSKIQTVYKNGSVFEKNLAYALYLTFNTEISSFAVQYYSFLKNNKIPLENVYDDFPFDDENPYGTFLDKKYFAEDNKERINDVYIRNLFGISKKEYFNRLENADKMYQNKMMKAATKYRDELHECLIRKITEDTSLNNTFLAKRLDFTARCYRKGIVKEVSEFD